MEKGYPARARGRVAPVVGRPEQARKDPINDERDTYFVLQTKGASSTLAAQPARPGYRVGMVGSKRSDSRAWKRAVRGIELWRAALRWRRQAEAELSPLGVTWMQWLALESTKALIEETGDAVNQAQIAARMELDKMTVSQLMTTLERLRLVDRGPDMSGRAYRIWVTASGQRALEKGRDKVEAASLAALGPNYGRLAKVLQVGAAELK